MPAKKSFGGWKWIFILLLAGGAFAGWRWYAKKPDGTAPEYKTTTVSKGDIIQVVTANGQINAVKNVTVGSQVSGIITDIKVESFHSRQDLPTLYCTSGGLYARKRELLERYDGSDFALGKSRRGILLDDIEAINIDRRIDLEFAEFMLKSGRIQDAYLT